MNRDNAKTMVRTRRIPFRPDTNTGLEQSANVLPIGTHLGEFEIQKVIGEGGFGIVYLAYDHSLERHVALKEYMPSGLATRTTGMSVTVRSHQKLETYTLGLKSFINEARMLAQFDSPALVKVHLFWEGNGTAYMVMPYYEGTTLKQALKEQQIKPAEPWLRLLLADLFDAIDIIHRAQCLHRDIAPDNILLLKDGRPLLLDFGAARRVIGDLTQCLTAILKPGFAPIEQYADIPGLRQGPWTDIYALAAVVYYLISGTSPPPAVARMVHDSMPPARELGKGKYSGSFLAAIDKALAVKPEQRYQSIGELRRALNIMEPVPRTLPQEITAWEATALKTAPMPQAKPAAGIDKPKGAAPFDRIEPTLMADDKTAVAPEVKSPGKAPDTPPYKSEGKPEARTKPAPKPAAAEQPADDKTMAWQHMLEQNDAIPDHSRSGKRLQWALVAVMLTTAVASGVYLGMHRPEDKSAATAFSLSAGDSAAGTSAAGAGEAPSAPAQSAPSTAAISPELLSEIESWKKASASDLAADYENYLRKYPKGSFAAIARLRLERLQAAAAPPVAPPPAEVAKAKPAPEKKPKAEPKPEQVAVAPKAPEISPEEEAWTRASTLNGESAYQTYLAEYPKGRYAALAKDRLATMKKAEAALRHESPQPPVATPQETPQKGMDILAERKPAEAAPAAAPKSPADTAASPRSVPDASDKLASLQPMVPGTSAAPKQPNAGASPPPEPAPITGTRSVALEGQIVTGEFAFDPKGRLSGQVRISWANGDRYEGSLVSGIKQGKGRFIWRNGQRYTGEWARDLPNGRGTFIFPDGSRYEGQVKDGMRHGHGTTRFRNGDVYTGEWSSGKTNGHGRYTWADGSSWEGEFRGGQRTENGQMSSADSSQRVAHGAPESESTASSGDEGQKTVAGNTSRLSNAVETEGGSADY